MIKLRHVVKYDIVQFWTLAVVIKAVSRGFFPEITNDKLSPWDADNCNKCIDWLIEHYPEEFCHDD